MYIYIHFSAYVKHGRRCGYRISSYPDLAPLKVPGSHVIGSILIHWHVTSAWYLETAEFKLLARGHHHLHWQSYGDFMCRSFPRTGAFGGHGWSNTPGHVTALFKVLPHLASGWSQVAAEKRGPFCMDCCWVRCLLQGTSPHSGLGALSVSLSHNISEKKYGLLDIRTVPNAALSAHRYLDCALLCLASSSSSSIQAGNLGSREVHWDVHLQRRVPRWWILWGKSRTMSKVSGRSLQANFHTLGGRLSEVLP